MKKLLVIAAFIALSAQSAFALSVTANAGAYVPTGKYGDLFKIGYTYGISAEQSIFLFTSIKLNYNRYHSEGKSGSFYSDADMQGDAVEVMIKLAPWDFIIEPYVAAGGGYYNNKIKLAGNKYTQDGFGFVGEAGLNFNFFIMSAGLAAKYSAPHISGDGFSDTAESFSVGATLSVHIPLL